MKTLLEEKLEAWEDEESLYFLKKLVSAKPKNIGWKFMMVRLLKEMGEILTQNPLSLKALFENALLIDSCREGDAVIMRLEKALEIAEEKKEKESLLDFVSSHR
uniref:Uncharacterized protein n=1 Tax=Lactuca sativa TaxID=4236 RepID=A0A9R1XM56_LACSA|nr:hypothetical protein LSAT_V11C300147430 [Lactuca sativa]